MQDYNENDKDGTFILRWAKKIKAFNLKGGKCARCENTDVRVIDFHHTYEKIEKVSNYSFRPWTIFWEEAKKCECLCRNCHTEEHSILKSRWQKRKNKIIRISSRKVICKICGHKNPLSLEFHHKDPSTKEFGISAAMRRGVCIGNILEEISKCDILCCNCHRRAEMDVMKFDNLSEYMAAKISELDNEIAKKVVDQKSVLELAFKGMSVRQIALSLKCSEGAVSGIIKRNNKIPPQNADEITMLEMRDKGYSDREIVKKTGFSRGRIRHILKTRIWGKVLK